MSIYIVIPRIIEVLTPMNLTFFSRHIIMSRIAFHLLCCVSAFLICCIQFSVAGNNETDRLALLEIKARIIDDPLGIMSSWNDTLDFCEWYGVTCGHRHQRVTVLNLRSSKLSGTISPYIGNLSFMTELILNNNSFGGTIPPEIGNLHRLQYLLFRNNSIGGEVPSNISRCSRLVKLDAHGNKLVGEIPPELGFLLNLEGLDLSINNFTGTIPSSLGNLSSLAILSIGTNNLDGSIPDSLGRLKNLSYLSLGMNNLFGVLPPPIFNLSALEVLSLGPNHLEGSLPSDLGFMLPNIQFFSIGDNKFSGSIPASISNFSNLYTLEMNSNKLRGQVPSLQGLERLQHLVLYDNFLGVDDQATDLDFVSSISNLTMLTAFEIGSNNFSGMFPRIICNFSMLSFFSLGGNKIFGEIPSCVTNLVNLQVFDVSENNLSGTIPQSVGRLVNIYILHVGINQLSGRIPFSVGNLTLLAIMNFAENNLQGDVPSTLGNCGNLNLLDLSFNHLSGRIPADIFHLSSLSVTLDLSNNRFSGPLSDEFGRLVNLVNLDISENLLSGDLPSTLGACVGLETILLQGNLFQGVIPTTMKTLAGLQILDLSRNNLSGEIPMFLQGLHLKKLNLSYNNLEGEVPTGGVFSNATGVSVFGNSKLCGGLLELRLHNCDFSREIYNRRIGHRNHLRMAVLFGISGFFLLVACISLYTFLYRKRTKKSTGSADLKSSLANLSYQMLHRATNGFSSENLIGSGASGVVYKGILDQDVGTVLAIKIFNLEHHGASKSFVAECNALRNIRHRNLIKVITACSSVDYQGNDFKALIYEYMVNGNLDEWLHPTTEISRSETTDDAPRILNIRRRLDIAVDVAFALEYLHYHCGSSVIHCDLKPSNVLLDEDLVAHVGDFGLAKFISQTTSSSHPNQSSSIGVRGTVGYAPPEYGMGNEVSICGDVYSFGILLLEVFTGKRPTDDIFTEGRSLHDFVKTALSEQDIKILDHALFQEMALDDSDSQIILESLVAVLEIALACSAELPRERPDMSEVAVKLSSIRNKVRGLHM